MIIKNKDGIQQIILEKNDVIYLTTKNCLESEFIIIECESNMLNISGDSSLIKKISGNNILEKVFIPPVISSKEIIDKCDKWLEMFKKVHDKFREILLTNKYLKMGVYMKLSFNEIDSFPYKTNKLEKITLDLMYNKTVVQECITITIDETNDDVCKYIIANVLNYYLSVNYVNYDVSHIILSLFSDYVLHPYGEPFCCNLNQFYCNEHKFSETVESIISNYKYPQYSKQLIDELKRNIHNQQLTEQFDRSIDYSKAQYEYIMSHPLILEKEKNK